MVNKKTVFAYMNYEDKYKDLFLAIKSLFDESDINEKELANSFITQWQLSDDSILECIELLPTVQEPHALFIIIKTVQIHVRFAWNIIYHQQQILLTTLLNLLIKSYISQLHQDFILILISDISNQTGILNEEIINSIPPELIFRFFTFFFENWHEPFITHLIQPNFISIGFEMLTKYEIGNEWFRMMKCLSYEINEIECFIPFFTQLIQIEITDENRDFFVDIISNFCNFNFFEFEKFQLFIEFFTNYSSKVESLYLWMPFFEIRTSFFDSDDSNFLIIFEFAMNEFYRICSKKIQLNSIESNFLWIDVVSISFSFFQEYNSFHMIKHELNFIDLVLTLLNSLIINDIDIKSVLSNLHILLAFQPFIQNQQNNLPFYLIIAYNSGFLPIEYVHQIAQNIFNVKNEFMNNFLLLSFIENTYLLLRKSFANQFLMIINEMFPIFPDKSSMVLYFVVSKDYMSIPFEYFELFHNFIHFESPFIIPSLLYLLKDDIKDFYIEIQSILAEMMNHLNIYNYLKFIFSMIKKFPKSELPFLSSFLNEFSIFIFNLLIPLSLNINDAIINNKIIEIFTVLIKRKYLVDFDLPIQWIDYLLTIDSRITEYHVDFISNFNIFLFKNLKQFLDRNLITLHCLSFDNANESELFKSIIELMTKISFECPIEMWSIFSIQFIFDALSMKSATVVENAHTIVLNNIKETSTATFFIKLLVSHLFTDQNKLSVVLLLSSISRKMDSKIYCHLIENSFPSNSEILNQFISLLMNSINIPRILSISQKLVEFYS